MNKPELTPYEKDLILEEESMSMICAHCNYDGVFIDTEVRCSDCGSHGASECPDCGAIYDRVLSEWSE